MKAIFGGACLAAACLASSGAGAANASAANSGELWEVTTQMNMPGMPPGMGSSTARSCNPAGDPKKQAENPATSKCKVTDQKQSGNKFTMTLACPDGTAVIEHAYNSAHTEYKGSMKMTMKDGNVMTMNMTGHKVGTCDAEQASREREEKIGNAKRQAAQGQAQLAAAEQTQITNCAKAVDAMDLNLLGTYGRCDLMQGTCEQMVKEPATTKVASACMSSRAQLCKRYQTMDGFLKANGNEDIAQTCGLDREVIAVSHCPRAEKSENLAYLGRYCPDQAKSVAERHCVGRDYTSAPRDKYTEFCQSTLARSSLGERQRPAGRRSEAPKPAQPQDAVTQGVSQGLNKLKGLFGR